MWIVILLCALVVLSGGAGILLLTRFPLRSHRPRRSYRKDLTTPRK